MSESGSQPSPFSDFKIKIEPSSDDEKKEAEAKRTIVFNPNLPESLQDDNWPEKGVKVWHLTPPLCNGIPGMEIIIFGVRGYYERGYSDPIYKKGKKDPLLDAYNKSNTKIGQVPHVFALQVNGEALKIQSGGKTYDRKFIVYKIDGVVKKKAGTYLTKAEVQDHVLNTIIPVLKTSPSLKYPPEYELCDPWYYNITSLDEVMDLKNMYNVLDHGFGPKSTTPMGNPMSIIGTHKSALYSMYKVGTLTKEQIDFWKLTKKQLLEADYKTLEPTGDTEATLAWATNPTEGIPTNNDEPKTDADFSTPAKAAKSTDKATEDTPVEETNTLTDGKSDGTSEDKNRNGKRAASGSAGRNTRATKKNNTQGST